MVIYQIHRRKYQRTKKITYEMTYDFYVGDILSLLIEISTK
jgi:hypothetical protein